jgi:hypothetical protein
VISLKPFNEVVLWNTFTNILYRTENLLIFCRANFVVLVFCSVYLVFYDFLELSKSESFGCSTKKRVNRGCIASFPVARGWWENSVPNQKYIKV